MRLRKNLPPPIALLKIIFGLNYHQEVIDLKKTLIPGMFSSVSDAELVTQLLDAADFNDNKDKSDPDVYPEVGKDNNGLLS